jgi:hypothetical protein
MSTKTHLPLSRDHGLSAHARIRLQQRAIRPAVLDFFLRHAERADAARGGCRALRLGESFEPVGGTDPHERALIEQARRLRVIESDDGTIVTAMWARRRPRPRLRLADGGAGRREIAAALGEGEDGLWDDGCRVLAGAQSRG